VSLKVVRVITVAGARMPPGAGCHSRNFIITGCAYSGTPTITTHLMTPVLNKPLPEFEAVATSGVKFTPQGFVGKVVVLYFYPKDHTPGCTTEAMQFRDRHKDFVKAGAVVFGVSRDNMASHEKFRQNLELPFDLIADTEEKLCHMFGVVKNKIMYGKKVKGIERSTFLIDAKGVLRAEWRGIKVAGHVDEVLKAVKELKKST